MLTLLPHIERNSTMLKNSLAILALSTTAVVFAAPASAGTQEDLEACRAALVADNAIAGDDFRLSFKSKKGNKARTLKLVAKTDDANYAVKCTVDKTGVTNLVVTAK